MLLGKYIEMDRVKAVWNIYAANKITVTIIKSWKEAMI
jgi:predicted aminopeptidase